jgi:hypothetical protein
MIIAQVIPVALELSKNILKFIYTEDNLEMETS